VSIVASQATAGEILAEWAKLGQVKVVNLELLSPERITIELHDVNEEQALAVVLRRASGYVAAPREIAAPALSRFDRLMVMRPVAARPVPVAVRAAGVRPAPPDAASGDPDAADPDEPADPDGQASDVAPVPPGAPVPQGVPVSPQAVVRRPGFRMVNGVVVDTLASDDAPPPSLGPNQVAVSGSPVASVSQPVAGPPVPPRPMQSGLMDGRRPTAPRDTLRAMPRQEGVDPSAIPVDDTFAPGAPAVIPPEDPVAQETFKARHAVETVDPRTFKFTMPKIAGQPGTGGPTPPATGAAVPGTVVPVPPKADPIIK